MIAVVGVVEVASAVAVLEAINLVINSFFNAQSVENAKQFETGTSLSLLQENNSSQDDEFVKEFVDLKGDKLNPEYFQQVLGENVISVERCCSSLWQSFPSGILTPFSWLIKGKAMRYEFVIVNTENFICLLEMRLKTKEKKDGQKQEFKIKKFIIQKCSSEKNRAELRTELLKKKQNFKPLATNTYKENEILKFSTLCKFSNFALECWKKMPSKSFDKAQLSKLFARSMIYFSQLQLDEDEVLKSIFGLFTDKPYGFARLDLIGVEKSVYFFSQLSKDKKEKIEQFKTIIREIRQDKY